MYQYNFDKTARHEKQIIKCTIDEFNQMLLDKEYMTVVIKRNEKSDFLFHEQPSYLSKNTKYMILNFRYGLAEATFTEKLDQNERNLNILEII